MVKRRTFLQGLGLLASLSLLSACGDRSSALTVLLLKGSIPGLLLKDFRRQSPRHYPLIFNAKGQLTDIAKVLDAWHQRPQQTSSHRSLTWPGKTPPQAHLTTLGDSWLAQAIQHQWLQPLPMDKVSQWQQLPSFWQQLVRRNNQGLLDGQGEIWGAPYRWGTMVIAFRRDKFKTLGWEPTDWPDLWREELRDRVSLLDHPRPIIGLALRSLGYSLNTADLTQIPSLRSTLETLNQQAKFYSSKHYLEPLILGDTWLAVGWSSDILPIQQRYPNIDAIVPRSGTALWADLWVRPAGGQADSSIDLSSATGDRRQAWQEWIDFCWQRPSALKISSYTNAISPVFFGLSSQELPQPLRENPVLNVDAAILDHSECLLPLTKAAADQYLDVWQQIRQPATSSTVKPESL